MSVTDDVLNVLRENGPMTARQIGEMLGRTERQQLTSIRSKLNLLGRWGYLRQVDMVQVGPGNIAIVWEIVEYPK